MFAASLFQVFFFEGCCLFQDLCTHHLRRIIMSSPRKKNHRAENRPRPSGREEADNPPNPKPPGGVVVCLLLHSWCAALRRGGPIQSNPNAISRDWSSLHGHGTMAVSECRRPGRQRRRGASRWRWARGGMAAGGYEEESHPLRISSMP